MSNSSRFSSFPSRFVCFPYFFVVGLKSFPFIDLDSNMDQLVYFMQQDLEVISQSDSCAEEVIRVEAAWSQLLEETYHDKELAAKNKYIEQWLMYLHSHPC